jgi:hypothetical protein
MADRQHAQGRTFARASWSSAISRTWFSSAIRRPITIALNAAASRPTSSREPAGSASGNRPSRTWSAAAARRPSGWTIASASTIARAAAATVQDATIQSTPHRALHLPEHRG